MPERLGPRIAGPHAAASDTVIRHRGVARRTLRLGVSARGGRIDYSLDVAAGGARFKKQGRKGGGKAAGFTHESLPQKAGLTAGPGAIREQIASDGAIRG
jgi:hypothetical protein